MIRESRQKLALALLLIALGVTARLLPHPANFAPITAIAIFGGAVLPRRLGVWVPVVAMVFSDVIIGLYSMIWVTWSCYLIIAIVSSYWLRKPTVIRGAILTLASSVFFFIVTNFAVWLGSGMYVHTIAGLMRCYAMAVPFFRNTVFSDGLYTSVLFSLYAFACNRTLYSKKTVNSTIRST
jgi:hypothetical protein